MSVPVSFTAVGGTLAPIAADPYGLTSGRAWASAAAVLALAGAVLGGLALSRAAGRPGRSVAALLLGAFGVVAGALVVGTADGGLGTGNGLGGGVVALALGLTGIVLGGIGLARARRAGRAARPGF